ncbi:endospore germination permease [Neobacillus sp. NPDC058068]|uniref:GerAB/ArcD/ProY family transporter n=1 Tax=Neobacillus sp. NPDC058068 TaxID=3346325 RepID=UPI0036DA4279
MKLSGMQLFWLMFSFETGNMLLLTIGPTAQEAKQDAWISCLAASVFGIAIVFIACKTALLFPKQSLIEFSKLILGKWVGTIVIIVYLIQWFAVIGNILREFADFTITILLPYTPPWALILTMLLLMIYVTTIGGIEGIGRCSEVFGTIIFLSLFALLILSAQNVDLLRILPVFSDTGIQRIWKGTLIPLAFLGESVMVLMLISFMDQPKKGLKSAVWGITAAACFISTVTLWVLMTLGPELTAKLRHPVFDTVSYISVMDFIQNLEIIAVLVWILSVFIKLSLYFFFVCYGTAQLFKVKNWRKMIWITAPFFFALAVFYPNNSYTFGYMKTYMVYFLLPINMVGIPILLLVVGSIRKKFTVSH